MLSSVNPFQINISYFYRPPENIRKWEVFCFQVAGQSFINCVNGYDRARAHGISLCENNLNQPVCSSFFSLLCLVASFSQLRCADFFVCFWGSWFCTPAINQTSVSQSKGWFSFVLLCRREKYHWKVSLDLHINYTNMRFN